MTSDDPVEPVPRRIPAGVMMSSTRHEPRHRQAEVLCTDQGWRPAEILAWARCQAGWAALIRWPDGTQDWRQHDRPMPAGGRPASPRTLGTSTRPAGAAGAVAVTDVMALR
jgi:hypothetical protein